MAAVQCCVTKVDEDADLVKVEPGNVARAYALVLHQAALVCKREESQMSHIQNIQGVFLHWYSIQVQKMLDIRPEDALALVKLVKHVKLYRLWRLKRLWRLWRL